MCALDRRTLLKGALAAPLVVGVPVLPALAASSDGPTMRRVRPGEPGGTSNAADSLLIWTHAMHEVTLHDAFIPEGYEGRQAAQPAVTVDAGALWSHVYDAVTTRAGRYVQGGGCMTVGVAGLVQGGGFG